MLAAAVFAAAALGASGSPAGVCFIGDSITRGAIGGFLPPTVVVADELHVIVINKGVSAASTWTWLPGTDLLENTKAECARAQAWVVSLMLGTNDGFRQTSPWAYRENLIEITNDLTASGFTVVLNYPLGSLRKDFQRWRAIAYAAQVDSIVNGVDVLMGDTTATLMFLQNPYLINPDLSHPNELGSLYLGLAWAQALRPLFPKAKQRPSHATRQRGP